MTEVDHAVAKVSMRLADRTTRRGLVGKFTRAMGVLMGASASSLFFTQSAEATHLNESILCLYHPAVQSNSCPYCWGGYWYACDYRCDIRTTVWHDCCHSCTVGCHRRPDPTDPNGYGWSCCFTGYCNSGCGGYKVLCRWFSCLPNPPC